MRWTVAVKIHTMMVIGFVGKLAQNKAAERTAVGLCSVVDPMDNRVLGPGEGK